LVCLALCEAEVDEPVTVASLVVVAAVAVDNVTGVEVEVIVSSTLLTSQYTLQMWVWKDKYILRSSIAVLDLNTLLGRHCRIIWTVVVATEYVKCMEFGICDVTNRTMSC
jgi:hypothetical protein